MPPETHEHKVSDIQLSLTQNYGSGIMLSMAQVPELMTVPEVATALRVSEETVRIWARAGRLRAVPMPSPRMLRFNPDDIEALKPREPVADSAA